MRGRERERQTDRRTERVRGSVCVRERERFMIQAISHEQQWH